MRTYFDCYPCFLRQALSAARHVDADEEQIETVMVEVLDLLRDIPTGATPPEIAYHVHHIVRAEVEAEDPYREAKDASTRQALTLYPQLVSQLAASEHPLETAIRLSIAGNIIDLAVADDYDLWESLTRVLEQPFAIDDRPGLFATLAEAEFVLFLADNAGETVFDRVLVETLDVPVTYAVKGGPILNDATLADARAAGLDEVATLVDTGVDAPGTILDLCSPTFQSLFASAPVVIAKGQANYETLSTADPKVFCLLQIKCPVIAQDIGAEVGDIVARQSHPA
ncbi:MAG: damage-control phosphatase ARMT1 family protein [Anaerolineales bacterium]